MSQPAYKANDFFAVFSSFELGGITKHLMTGPAGNIESVSSMLIKCKLQTIYIISGNYINKESNGLVVKVKLKRTDNNDHTECLDFYLYFFLSRAQVNH